MSCSAMWEMALCAREGCGGSHWGRTEQHHVAYAVEDGTEGPRAQGGPEFLQEVVLHLLSLVGTLRDLVESGREK